MMDFPILILQLRAAQLRRFIEENPDNTVAKDNLNQMLDAIRTLREAVL